MIATPEPSIALIGHLIGNPARANILSLLLDGRAFTATELAYHAGVTPQTTSSHLAKLADAKLIIGNQDGRHRYYRLAGPHIADALEPLTNIVPTRPVPQRHRSKELERLRAGRLCYDHLAGQLGVTLADALQGVGYITAADERDFTVTPLGADWFADLEVDLAALRSQRRVFARQCLDWSERRPHLGGVLGAALASAMLKRKWLRHEAQGRRVTVTPAGRQALPRVFPGLDDRVCATS